MTKRQSGSGSQQQLPPPTLTTTRFIAGEKISAQIQKGKAILDSSISSHEDLRLANDSASKWSAYNTELLTRLFTNLSMANEYNDYIPGGPYTTDYTFDQEVGFFRDLLHAQVKRLEGILERLDLVPESAETTSSTSESRRLKNQSARDVFVVHGRDAALKETVARFLALLDLNPIILHERANAGRTLIEKFVDNSNVAFAVVIMTPDDLGFLAGHSNEQESRARQNVIFELGYFIGLLGRERVCALQRLNVVPPSDWEGVAYIPMDDAGAWKLLLAKEMRHAGIQIDLNKAV